MARKMVQGQRLTAYGQTQEEADERLKMKLEESEHPALNATLSLHEFACAAWEPLIELKKDATKRRYMAAYKHIYLSLGNRQLDSIVSSDIQRFVNDLSKRQVSRSGKGKTTTAMGTNTIRFTVAILSQILGLAVDLDLLSKKPMSKRTVTLPRKQEKRERYLDTKEALEMLESAPSDLRCAVFLAGFLGLRRGEICGLQWSDIDREKRTIKIVRQRTNKGTIEPLKTTSSRRTLTLPTAIIDTIYRFGDVDHPTYPVPASPRDITYAWSKWAKKPKGWTFHDLRHGAAGLLNYATGGDVLAVQAILGHANPDMSIAYTANKSTRTETAFIALEEEIRKLTPQ